LDEFATTKVNSMTLEEFAATKVNLMTLFGSIELLEQAEYHLRMMIVGSNKYGRFVLLDGIHTRNNLAWLPRS